MRYTEALEAIRNDHTKRFMAYNKVTEETLIVYATDTFYDGNCSVEMTSWGGSRVSYLTFAMMDFEWTEEKK